MSRKRGLLGPVGIIVLGGVIVGVILSVFTKMNLLSTLAGVAAGIARLAIRPVTLAVWKIVLLAAAPAIMAVVLVRRRAKKRDYRSYTQDRIADILWQWEWRADRTKPLIPLCPKCQYQANVAVTPSSGCTISCPNCGFRKEFDRHLNVLLDMVEKEIHRRVRTGEYRKAAAAQPSPVVESHDSW